MAHIIDGKIISAAAREEIARRGRELEEKTGIKPGLAVVIVGEDPASKVYVRNKKKLFPKIWCQMSCAYCLYNNLFYISQ